MLGKKYIILGLTLCLLFVAGNAMALSVSGTVYDRAGAPLGGVNITAAGTGACSGYTTTTAPNGTFTISCACSGTGNVIVSFTKAGYAQAVMTYDCAATLTGEKITMPDIGVPTMTEWGWIALVVLIIAGSAIFILRRKRATA